MPEVDACKFGHFAHNEDYHNVWPYCELGHPTDDRCLTKGRPECKSYKRLIVLTAEEMRQKIKEEGERERFD